MAAEQAAPLSDKTVIVIPSKTVPQGITAMLNFDASMEPEDNVSAMTESLDTVLTMQITYAARNSDFDGHEIHEGDYLGLAGGALLGTSRNITELLTQMADKVAAEGQEFVNIFYGSDITEADAEAAADIFRAAIGIDDKPICGDGHRVHRKIAPHEVGRQVADEGDAARVTVIGIVTLGAEGRDLRAARADDDCHGAVLYPGRP